MGSVMSRKNRGRRRQTPLQLPVSDIMRANRSRDQDGCARYMRNPAVTNGDDGENASEVVSRGNDVVSESNERRA